MKKLVLLWATLLAVGAAAQSSFTINPSTIASGGGTATNGLFALTGTIGQTALGTSSAGNYSLQAGFWAMPVVMQTPGAPVLRIARTATNTVLLAWPVTSTTFTLQVNNDLATTNWTAVASPANIVGNDNQVTIPMSAAARFYRLQAL